MYTFINTKKILRIQRKLIKCITVLNLYIKNTWSNNVIEKKPNIVITSINVIGLINLLRGKGKLSDWLAK